MAVRAAGCGIAAACSAAICLAAPAVSLPPEAAAALSRAHVPPESMAAIVQAVDNGPVRLSWNARTPMNPASVFKLFTTFWALDRLGPAWSWTTPVWVQGRLQNGVLEGAVTIKGSGDPALVVERVWLLLQRLQQYGVREIVGDIVLDSTAFAPYMGSAADFDGDPLRPYNVRPDALMLNFKSVTLTFRPDPARGVARLSMEPALAGVQSDESVPLAGGACADWRSGLKQDPSDPLRLHFTGRYPAACGERVWPMAFADPAHYNARLVEQLWRQMGGRLSGRVREGTPPVGMAPSFEWTSPPLADVVRDINKFSNNVMAEQLFLTSALMARSPSGLGAAPSSDNPSSVPTTAQSTAPATGLSTPPAPPVSRQEARDALRRWVTDRWGAAAAAEFAVDNGSGLSRDTRVSAELLAQLLQAAWRSPVMPELMASLPIIGVDGTLRHASVATGAAHLKTGSLRDVAAVAGYVTGQSGRRYVVVAIVQHPKAGDARPAVDAMVQWAVQDNEGPEPQNR